MSFILPVVLIIGHLAAQLQAGKFVRLVYIGRWKASPPQTYLSRGD